MNERIKEIRKEQKLTQQEFAKRINIKQATISGIERGNWGITERVIKDICQEFNVNEDWLRYGTGPKYIEQSEDEELATWLGTVLAGKGLDDAFIRSMAMGLKKMQEDGNLPILMDFVRDIYERHLSQTSEKTKEDEQ